eukprot:183803_1
MADGETASLNDEHTKDTEEPPSTPAETLPVSPEVEVTTTVVYVHNLENIAIDHNGHAPITPMTPNTPPAHKTYDSNDTQGQMNAAIKNATYDDISVVSADDHKQNTKNEASKTTTVSSNKPVPNDAANEVDNEEEDDPEDWPKFDGLSLCYPMDVYRQDWKQLKNEILAGVIVSFAQIPESIAFAYLAGLPPSDGLQAAWIVGLFTALFGGRPSLISGATGAIAAVQSTIKDKGTIYPIMVLAGVWITLCGVLNLTKFARLIPHSAMIGFLNGLAIIITVSQIHIFEHTHSVVALILMIVLSFVTFLIVYLLPRYTKMIPSSLLGILVAILFEYAVFRALFGIETPLISDMGLITGGVPSGADVASWGALDWWSLMAPSLWITLVAISEDVMTIDVVSEMTATRPKTQAAQIAQVKQQVIVMGLGNVISGFLGTMGGGSMIGISIISCFQGSGGHYRWTGVVAALCVLFITLVASEAISAIPAAALVGIMACTVHHTFEYESILIVLSSMAPQTMRQWVSSNVYEKSQRKIQRADAFVIILVTILTLVSNLGVAIVCGLVFSCVVYAWQSATHLTVYAESTHNTKIYHLEGPLFFGNAKSVVQHFTPKSDPNDIEIHLRDAQIYDYSAINALNIIAEKYKKRNKSVHLKHISDKSQKLIKKAHNLISHFTYDTIAKVEDHGEVSITQPHHYHAQQYPR